MKGRPHGYGPHGGGLCWLVLDMGPCFISSDRRDAWHSAAKQGEMVLTNKTWWVDDEQK